MRDNKVKGRVKTSAQEAGATHACVAAAVEEWRALASFRFWRLAATVAAPARYSSGAGTPGPRPTPGRGSSASITNWMSWLRMSSEAGAVVRRKDCTPWRTPASTLPRCTSCRAGYRIRSITPFEIFAPCWIGAKLLTTDDHCFVRSLPQRSARNSSTRSTPFSLQPHQSHSVIKLPIFNSSNYIYTKLSI